MLIYSITQGDLVNYPGHMSTVIATQGCDQRCPYCHNPHLLPTENEEATFYRFPPFPLLKGPFHSKYIVITGGEPTLQANLLLFTNELAKCGYKIKLDTNSTYKPVSPFIQNLDCVALDIKYFHQPFLIENIALALTHNKKLELRFTCYGNEVTVADKLKSIIYSTRTALNLTKKPHTQQNKPSLYIQQTTQKYWSTSATQEFYDHFKDWVDANKMPINIYKR